MWWDNSTCSDCNGIPYGNNVIDECGNCNSLESLDYNCNDIAVIQDIFDANNCNWEPLGWTSYLESEGWEIWEGGNLINLRLTYEISSNLPESIGSLSNLKTLT